MSNSSIIFDDSGFGDPSGTLFDNSTPTNVSYNTIGAAAGTNGTASYALTASFAMNGGGGGGSLTVVGGATVTGVTTLTFSGGTVSGTTPNATVTISGGASASYAASASVATSASYTYSSSVAVSASYSYSSSVALSSSYALNATSASYALTSTSASYTLNATSASYALNAATALSSSYALNATSASYARSSSVAVSSSFANNSSTALSSSYALNATTAFNSTNAVLASNVAVTNVTDTNPYYLTFAQTDGYTNLFINSASVAGIGTLSYDITTNTIGANLSGSVDGTITSASYAQTASYSNTLGASLTNPGAGTLRLFASNGNSLTTISNFSASYTLTASYALTATNASYALTSTSASYALTSTSASYARSSSVAVSASYSLTSTSASYALTSTTALSASYALNSAAAVSATSVNFTGIKSLPAALSGSGGYGGVSDVASLTSNQASNSLINGMFYNASSAGGAITITLDAATYFGFEFTVFASNLTNDISFMAGAAQTIISADSNLKINKAGSSAVAKYITGSTWALIGDLKA